MDGIEEACKDYTPSEPGRLREALAKFVSDHSLSSQRVIASLFRRDVAISSLAQLFVRDEWMSAPTPFRTLFLDAIRILLRCSDSANSPLLQARVITTILNCIGNWDTSFPALKCLVNLQMLRQDRQMLDCGLFDVLVPFLLISSTESTYEIECKCAAVHVLFMVTGLNPDSFSRLIAAVPDDTSVAGFMEKIFVPLLSIAIDSHLSTKLGAVSSAESVGTDTAVARESLAEKLLKLYQVVRTRGEHSFIQERSPAMGAAMGRVVSLLMTALVQSRRASPSARDTEQLGPAAPDLHRSALQGLAFAADASLDGGREQREIAAALLREHPVLTSASSELVVQPAPEPVRTDVRGSPPGSSGIEVAVAADGRSPPGAAAPPAQQQQQQPVAVNTALQKLLTTLSDLVQDLSPDSPSGGGGGSGGSRQSKGAPSTRELNLELVPLLMVLTRAVGASEAVLRRTKAAVFPPAADAVWQRRLAEAKAAEDAAVAAEEAALRAAAEDSPVPAAQAEPSPPRDRGACASTSSPGEPAAPPLGVVNAPAAAAGAASSTTTSSSSPDDPSPPLPLPLPPPPLPPSEAVSAVEAKAREVAAAREARAKKRQEELMHPVDAPPGSLRCGLCALVTSLDSNVKRCVSEFLLALCRGDLDEFTLRCGYGNAAYMHHVMGALQVNETTASALGRSGPAASLSKSKDP